VKNRVEKQVSASKPNRFMELEGLRVIAAIIVVFYHALLIFYPGMFYGVGDSWAPVQNMPFEKSLYENPIGGLWNGTFAVGIFFVLSGFVLSVGYLKKKDSAIVVKLASKRYLRLMLPAAVSIMIAWLVLSLGLAHNISEVVSVTHSGWLDNLWVEPPDFLSALYQGVVSSFTIGEVYYNPVLWTISLEFMGSFIIFGVLLLFGSSRYRWLVYGILLYVLANSWLLGFISGLILADVYVNRQIVFRKLSHKITYLLIPIGIALGGYPSSSVSSSFYRALQIPGFEPSQQKSFYITLGAVLVVIGVLSLSSLRRFMMSTKISRLGKYTYSLYLIHIPVLLTVCTSTFLLALPIGFHKASVIAILVTAAVLMPITYLFEKYIDTPSIRFSSYSAEIFLGKKELNIKAKAHNFKIWYNRILRRRLGLKKRNGVMPEIEAE
jgi:peptidoglycan/LPS O-acetylase OafA/YrhL